MKLFFSLCTLACLFISAAQAATSQVELAQNGKARHAVITAHNATEKTRKAAQTLASYLSRIAGVKFEVKNGDGTSGIAVGTKTDFPGLQIAEQFAPDDAQRREEYMLRSHDRGLYLIGATEMAVSHAVWDLLYRLGYRQFFPNPHWEVVPVKPDLKISVDTLEKPDFLARRIWYGFGSWKINMQDKAIWDERNRMGSGIDIRAGHAWDTIRKDKKAQFDAHPEYLVSNHPTKFCISNPGLRKLVVDWALEYFAKNPESDSLSLDPSDGGGWDTPGACRDAQVYASVSDRVITLANEVAEAVNQKYNNKYVSLYAYYQHSAPPTIKVHPNVSVNVATAYIQGGFSFEQLIDGWRKQGAQLLGVREYYSVFSTHWDRPAGPGSSNPRRIAQAVKKQYALGGRLMSAESSESWGPGGLGYYLSARLQWDTGLDVDVLIEDFLDKAFGPAKEPMREFYHLIDRAGQPLFTRHLVGSMYRRLSEARQLTTDSAIQKRLDDLVLWTRYCEMLLAWQNEAKTKEAKKALGEAMLKYTYRWHRSGMMHSYVFWRHSFKLEGSGHPGTYPPETKFQVPEGQNPWKLTNPVTSQEIEAFLREGIANNPVVSFKTVSYSRDLLPVKALNLPEAAAPGFSYTRGEQNFYVWFADPQVPLQLEVTAGQIATRANTTLSLYPLKSGESFIQEEENEDGLPPVPGEDVDVRQGVQPGAVVAMDVPNDRHKHTVELKVNAPGLYRLRIYDRGKGAGLVWPAGWPVTVEASAKVQTLLRGTRSNAMFFYVPKGTKVIGGYAQGRPVLVDGSGKAVQQLSLEADYFSVPVPPGQDGKLWRVDRVTKLLLMTVPPFLARSAGELLLPREVIEAERLR